MSDYIVACSPGPPAPLTPQELQEVILGLLEGRLGSDWTTGMEDSSGSLQIHKTSKPEGVPFFAC